jgi:hypothetical protein
MRLKSHIWVSAYLRRLDAAFIPAVVVHRGDADAGAVYIKISHLDGTCQILAPMPAYLAQGLPSDSLIIEEGRAWQAIYPEPSAEAEADCYLKRQAHRDPDIWILEVESVEGRHFLGDLSYALAW